MRSLLHGSVWAAFLAFCGNLPGQPGAITVGVRLKVMAGSTNKEVADVVRVTGAVRDSANRKPLPARIYIRGSDGAWHFPRSQSADGSAIPYRKQRAGRPASVEMHTTLSAHPFQVDLPPGTYTFTVEHGKDYHTESREVKLGREPVTVDFSLRRWINLAERGWYSGDTHVHRTLEELPNVMLAEDLNVAFPQRYWVTEAFAPPRAGAREPEPAILRVDDTHVIYPRNTEYEIFTVGKKPHTLGAFFILRHKKLFDRGVPPVRPVAEQAHAEGGLLELDKPNWPWSMVLVALMKVDLFELANNHVWRTEFGFPEFGERPPDFLKVERDALGFTEGGWIDFNFKHYYLLLNCGYRLRTTAGTASGVHPVPLGFGRVYVELPGGFSFEDWFKGLDAGRSFVSTGPMLFVKVNDRPAGQVFKQKADGPGVYRLRGTAVSGRRLKTIEVVVNGEVVRTLKPANKATAAGGWESDVDVSLTIDHSSWLVVRCFEDHPEKRVRFAHTAPWHVEVAGKPLRPGKAEADYLVRRVREQVARSKDVLPAAALAEYREALRVFEELARNP